ncbi:hypothetical protein [Paractinoplanes globisporus]|uniref:Integral membrane protein n=1 Tax=Paractinoplanes globisporus TaxID=113565 RepID=A0ABW6WDN3_9ACTN|nr:hypothetical protein [Actinoplanes globisporus]
MAAVTAIVLVPLTYLALVVAGVESGAATLWAPGFAAVLLAVALARDARTPATPADVNRRPLLWRGAVMVVLVLLFESIAAGVIGVYAPVAATDGPHSHPVQLHDALITMLGLPIVMFLIFRLGVWSSRWLAGPHPLVWLAAIALSSRAIRVLLSWPAATYAEPRNLVIYGLGYTLVRNAILAVLIFCLLALGNRHGHRRTAR